ncbi:MAG: IBR domain-containing protein [Bdellovibrionia bacterium]
MNRFWIFSIFILSYPFLSLSASYGSPEECAVCLQKTNENPPELTSENAQADFICCSEGHPIHLDCLLHQAKNTEILSKTQAETITREGLPCYGLEGQCLGRISLQEAKARIGGSIELDQLKLRLESALSLALSLNEEPSKASSSTASSRETKLRSLKDKIEKALNLTCPNSRCAQILGEISGCNAAVCPACRTEFCYLCFKKASLISGGSHQCAQSHSLDYWENRDGHTGKQPNSAQEYQEVKESITHETDLNSGEIKTVLVKKPYTYRNRYHWLITRSQVDLALQSEPDGSVRQEALEWLKPLLNEHKLWPFPLGPSLESWVDQVRSESSNLDTKNQIALLQNEGIFQKTLPNSKIQSENLQSIQNALDLLHAPLLETLDYRIHTPVLPPVENRPPSFKYYLCHGAATIGKTVSTLAFSGATVFLFKEPQKCNRPHPSSVGYWHEEAGPLIGTACLLVGLKALHLATFLEQQAHTEMEVFPRRD